MAIGLALAAPKIGQIATVIGLIGMGVLLVHPLWKLPYVRKAVTLRKRWVRFAEMFLASSLVLFFFGVWVWPPAHRHRLEKGEWEAFQAPLKRQIDPKERIQILCPPDDESSCVYAGQFVNVFRDAGWTVENNGVQRVAMQLPTAGVSILTRGEGQLDPNNWRSGLWQTWTPSFISVCQSFEGIGIEPEAYATLQQHPDEIALYFGPEKENPSEKTAVTYWMEKVREHALKPGLNNSN